MSPPLQTSVLRGLGWLTGAQSARQSLQILCRVLLVRLLAPEEFGLLAMVTVVTGFLLMLQDLGFGPALVRQEKVTQAELSTVFWLNVGTGVALALITAAMGPLLAWFYSQPRLVPVCAALALGSFAAPLGTVHSALLQRRLEFHRIARVDVIGVAAGGAVGIALALSGWGVWALVWQSNVTALAVLLTSVVQARWLPHARFAMGAAAGLWRFSGQFTAAQLFNYCIRNLDNLLVGRFLGAVALGFYSQAYQLMLYPVQYVAALAGRVMFPALATVQADRERLRRGYLRALRGIAALTFPLMLGAMVLAPDLYAVLFGPRWERSVFLFQILCLLGMSQSVGTTAGWLYLATGRTDLMLRWILIAAAVILPGFVVGLRLGGLEGVAISYVVTSGLLIVPSLLPAFRLIHLKPGEAGRVLAPLLAAAAGMALLLAGTRWLMLSSLLQAPPWIAGPAIRLVLVTILGAVAYTGLLQAFGQTPLVRAARLWRVLRSG